MKKLVLLLVLISLSITACCQPAKDSSYLRERLLRISDVQEDLSLLCFLTGGGLAFLTSKIIEDEQVEGTTILQMSVVSVGFIVTGFMLQKIAAQNEANANRIGITVQKVFLPGHHPMTVRRQPALSLRICL